MMKLQQLIQDMCPHGVEWKTLGDVTKIIRGERVTKAQLVENGQYPVVSGGINPMGYIDKYNREANTITIAQYGTAGYVNYITEKFWANDVCYSVYPNEKLLNRFLYYYLVHKQGYFYSVRNTDAVPYSIALEKIKILEIPIPPLEIQKKIVECLDKFSALAAELQAELHLRRKQYEYYRTQLLTPHSESNSADKTDDCNWEWKTLGEICTILRGKRLTKSELSEDEKYPVFHGGIEPLGYYKEHNREADTVMIINVGASAGTVGYSDKEFWSSDGCYCLSKSESAIPKFMYYLLQKRESELKSRVRYAGIPTLDSDVIKKMQIALPPLAEQARIVSILDKFEALTTSLSDGIPAEQAAQQKRYEYYRDLLLTFDRKAE